MTTPQTTPPGQQVSDAHLPSLRRGNKHGQGQDCRDTQQPVALAAQTTRTANDGSMPTPDSLSGPDSLNGHIRDDTQYLVAVEGQDSPQAICESAPNGRAPAGSDSLNGQNLPDTLTTSAVEGSVSPQAKENAMPIGHSPAGSKTSHGQRGSDTQSRIAVADDSPGGQPISDTQGDPAAGDQTPVPAIHHATPIAGSPVRDQAPPAAKDSLMPIEIALLADPFLALAADVLDDLEKVRIANENRLRQLTRSEEDSDGETRGFGLDDSHPDVARLAALIGMLADAEHKAALNLQRVMRAHPLGPWVKATKGIGEKQGARLIASIGDPYLRPEITREDGTIEPSRPRKVSELWAYAGYHVVPAGHAPTDTHGRTAGGEVNGSDPGHLLRAGHSQPAGVAPKRQRGQKANWSAVAKMRAFLVAESCIKQASSPYRPVYDATRAKYADAVHGAECIRCGPKNKPALPGSPLSDGHKHARALRAVAKEILKDLWREASRLHGATEGDPACG